jgi:MFS transporter, ACS family, pantothenate transporter
MFQCPRILSPTTNTTHSFLQAGIYNGMNGRAGLRGWRWLFIFDGIISLPIALCGFWLIPDSPANSRVFYLTQVDKETGQARLDKLGRAKASPLTWQRLRGIITHWPMWVFVIPYM